MSAARNFGFVFKTRTPKTVTIEVFGKEEVYELLCILDFNNVRKRMSVSKHEFNASVLKINQSFSQPKTGTKFALKFFR